MAVQPEYRVAREAAERTLRQAATRGERFLSMARALFCALEALRYLIVAHVEQMSAAGFALGFVPGVVAVGACAFILRYTRRRLLSPVLLVQSVVLDWALCLTALMPNVIWPWPGYPGITRVPDIGLLPVVVFSAVFRLSPKASLLSGALNFGTALLLFLLDYRFALRGEPWNADGLSMVMLACASATAVAVASTWWTRRLVVRGAMEGWKMTRARRTLDALMEEGHGIRSLLSCAKQDADRLASLADDALSARQRELVRNLHEEISELVNLSRRSRERSYAALASLQAVPSERLPPVAERVSRLVWEQFPEVKFDLMGAVENCCVQMVGGEAAFERILLNLLTNACEGDGQRGAQRVEVQFLARGEGLQLTVSDDGPGFPRERLEAPLSCVTTKSGGTGIGLFLISRIMQETQGTFTISNRPEGGASVSLSFPKPDLGAGPAVFD